MNHPNRRIKLNNNGTTLVELVVSLLILTIIVVPLLNSFVIAQRANMTARDKAYASTAAENVIEAVKAVAPNEIGRDFDQVLRGVLSNAVTYDDTTGASKYVRGGGGDDDVAAKEAADKGIGIYWISNYQEGTDAFDIRLTIEESDYARSKTDSTGKTTKTQANDYKFANMSAFSDETSVMIFPGIGGIDFDETALNSFYEDHSNWMSTKWSADYATAYDEYLERYHEWENTGEGTEPVFTEPDQSLYQPMSLEDLKSRMSRDVTIEVVETASTVVNGSGSDRKTATVYSYELKSVVKYTLDNSYSPKGSSGSSVDLGVCQDSYYSTCEKEYSGYCSESVHEGLESIYLIYSPFCADGTDPSKLTFDREQVSITTNATQEMSIFIVVQTTAADITGSTLPGSLNVDLIKSSGIVNLYSQATLACTAVTAQRGIVESNTDGETRIFDVTVEVFRHTEDAAHSDSDTVLAKLTSTVFKQQ